MWGAEGERLQQARTQKAAQYAADLRRQIDEKTGKSPIIITPNVTPPQRTATVNPTQPRIREPIPDFSPTSIAPLDLTVTSYSPDPIPSLPRQQTHSGSFDERLQSISGQLDQQRSMISQTSDSTNRFIHTHLPSLEATITEMENSLSKLLQQTLPTSMKPAATICQANRASLESELITSDLDEIRENLTNASTNSIRFTTTFNDFSEFSKTAFLEQRTDLGRFHDSLSVANQRITQLTNRQSQIYSYLGRVSTDYQHIDGTTLDAFSQFQQGLTDTAIKTVRQLSGEIQIESEKRNFATTDLNKVVEDINHRASESISLTLSTANSLSSSFEEALRNLNDSISTALEQTQIDNEAESSDLSSRLDSYINETEDNFNTMQTEIVSTIESIKTNSTQSRDLIENAVKRENQICIENQRQIFDRFDRFEGLVEQELILQNRRCDELAKEILIEGGRAEHKATVEILQNLSSSKSLFDKIIETESLIDQLESSFRTASKQVFEGMNNISLAIGDVQEKTSLLAQQIDTDFKELDKRSRAIEEVINTREMSNLGEIQALENEFESIIETRVQSIEQQIGVALTTIAELTVSSNSNTSKMITDGTKMVQQLVASEMGYKGNILEDDFTPITTERSEHGNTFHLPDDEPIPDVTQRNDHSLSVTDGIPDTTDEDEPISIEQPHEEEQSQITEDDMIAVSEASFDDGNMLDTTGQINLLTGQGESKPEETNEEMPPTPLDSTDQVSQLISGSIDHPQEAENGNKPKQEDTFDTFDDIEVEN